MPFISSVAFLCVVVAVVLLSMLVRKRRCGKLCRYFYLAQRIGKVTNYAIHKKHKCLNCGNIFVGNFCPCCGQSGYTQRTIKFGGLLKHICFTMVKFGSGMGRTLIDLLWRPGFMIRDYLVGRRVMYASPFLALLFMVFFSTLVRTDFPIEQKPMIYYFNMGTSDKAEGAELRQIKDHIDKSETNAKMKGTIQRYTFGMKLLGAIKDLVVTNSRMFKILFLLFPFLMIAFALVFRRQMVDGRRLNLAEYLVVQCYMMSLMLIAFTMLYVTGYSNRVLSADLLILIVTIRQLFDDFSWRKAMLYAMIVVGIFFSVFAFFIMLGLVGLTFI